MVADYFGCYILIGVGPLIEDARSSGTEGNQTVAGDAAYLVDLRLRQTKWSLRIRVDLIPAPPCSINTSLIEERW